MVGSRYVSDPEVWRKKFKNMLHGKFDPEQYRGRQSGRGIGGMYGRKLFMIPVDRHAHDDDDYLDKKVAVREQVSSTSAALERAKSVHT